MCQVGKYVKAGPFVFYRIEPGYMKSFFEP